MRVSDPFRRPRAPRFEMVVVGASAGGTGALGALLGQLPDDFGAPVVVVQHRQAGAQTWLHQILGRRTGLCVREARDGDLPRAGCVYVAPPGLHLRVGAGGALALDGGPPVNFTRPAADPLFASAAELYGGRVLGVVLTGRGRDGAAGAAAVRRRGGVVLVQDPATCAAPSMPQAVLAGGGADFVLPVEKLGHALVSLVMAPSVSAALFGLPVGVSA